MSIGKWVAAAMAAGFVCGCAATLPADFSYEAVSDNALVVFDSSVASDGATVILAPIDTETNRFIRIPAQFVAGAGNQTEEDPEGRTYYVEQLDPGRYVLAGVRYATYPQTTVCYSRGAPVFHFERGVANVISQPARTLGPMVLVFETDDGMSDPEVRRAQAQAALASVPGIAGDVPVRLVESEGSVRFQRQARLVGPGCPGAAGFEPVESPQQALGDKRMASAPSTP